MTEMKSKEEVEETAAKVKRSAKKRVRKKHHTGEFFPGSDLMKLVFGGNYPYGYINSVGDSSSGKSFIAGEFIGSTYHKLDGGLQWFYHDAEEGFRFKSEQLWGIDIINDGFLKPERGTKMLEDFDLNLQEVIKKKDPDLPFIYVIDSWDSLTTYAELAHKKKQRSIAKKAADGKEVKEAGTYNLDKQKSTHSFFRTTLKDIIDNKIILYVISQTKENIGVMFGKKLYRTGGSALDFYANIVFWLAEAEKYYIEGRPYGICTKVQGTKVRNDRPFRECTIDILFEYGIDNISSNLKFLYDLKTKLGKDTADCEKPIMWDDQEFENLNVLIDYIGSNNLMDELVRRVEEKWEKIEIEVSAVAKSRPSKW